MLRYYAPFGYYIDFKTTKVVVRCTNIDYNSTTSEVGVCCTNMDYNSTTSEIVMLRTFCLVATITTT